MGPGGASTRDATRGGSTGCAVQLDPVWMVVRGVNGVTKLVTWVHEPCAHVL